MQTEKRLHRFLIDEEITNQEEITLTDQGVVHQLKDVLRLKEGNEIILLDGKGTLFHGVIHKLMKKESIISKKEIKKFSRKNEIKMNLFFSMVKKDKAEWVIQKATELGVSQIYPVLSDRTEKTGMNIKRTQKIIKEAVEQSERVYTPLLHEPVKLEDAINKCETGGYILNMDGKRLTVSQLPEEVNLFVGPEGGWSEKDMEMFGDRFEKISINKNVLRAETAAIAATAIILH
jgi:16S rRNA (uracil1498-N3)-methyltransferase